MANQLPRVVLYVPIQNHRWRALYLTITTESERANAHDEKPETDETMFPTPFRGRSQKFKRHLKEICGITGKD